MANYKSRCIVCGKTTHNSNRCPEHRVCEICGGRIQKGKYCEEHRYPVKRRQQIRYQRRHYRALPIHKAEMIERRCLKCNQKFMAEGRFNRICPECAQTNQYIVDPIYAYGHVAR